MGGGKVGLGPTVASSGNFDASPHADSASVSDATNNALGPERFGNAANLVSIEVGIARSYVWLLVTPKSDNSRNASLVLSTVF